MMRRALSVAGFDPTSGAGITSDIKTFQALKVYGIGIISSITVQNTLEVKYIEPVSKFLFKKQCDALLDDILPDAAKVGMLYDRDIIEVLCGQIDQGRIKNIVLDPVIISSSGNPLIKKDALNHLVHEVFPRCLIVTPNIQEAEAITGLKIRTSKDMYAAAEKVYNSGPRNVLIKGGHLRGDPVDLLFDGNEFREYKSVRIRGRFHGTGCVLSSAITAGLSHGKSLREAVRKAKGFITKSIEKAVKVGKGMYLLQV